MSFILLIVGVTIGSFAQIPLKFSAKHNRAISLSYFINSFTMLGYAMMLIASACSFIAIRNLELKHAAVIESISYIYILLISAFVFKEKATPRKVLACLLIIAGITIFNL